MISCWKSLLSAILQEPEIPNVYGHVLRYEYGVSTKWEQVSKIHKKNYNHNTSLHLHIKTLLIKINKSETKTI